MRFSHGGSGGVRINDTSSATPAQLPEALAHLHSSWTRWPRRRLRAPHRGVIISDSKQEYLHIRQFRAGLPAPESHSAATTTKPTQSRWISLGSGHGNSRQSSQLIDRTIGAVLLAAVATAVGMISANIADD